MKKQLLFIFGFFTFCWQIEAQNILQPDSVSSDLTSSYGTSLISTINGSGLDTANNTHSPTTPSNSFVSNETIGLIDYHFQTNQEISSFTLWSQNSGGPSTDIGIQDVELYYSNDGTNFILIGDSIFSFEEELNDFSAPQTISFTSVYNAKVFRVKILSNHGGFDGIGLAEIAFNLAPAVLEYSCPDDIDYCSAIAGYSGFEWSQEVTFNGMTATTGNNGGYISYVEDETKQVNVAPNGVVNLNMTPGFSYWAYHVGWKIFVDWNQNGDFDDAGELVYSGFSNSGQSGQFTVPVDVEEGCYAMRIANAWGAYPSTGCSNVTYGEIEDYKLSVEGLQPPQTRKASLVVADVDHISYDFEFAANQVLISQGEEIDITLRSRNSGNSQFNISNSLGQIVSSIDVNHQEGIGSIQVSTADLSKGIYFIGNSKSVNAVKVIVQ
jgi:hypothetical protein